MRRRRAARGRISSNIAIQQVLLIDCTLNLLAFCALDKWGYSFNNKQGRKKHCRHKHLVFYTVPLKTSLTFEKRRIKQIFGEALYIYFLVTSKVRTVMIFENFLLSSTLFKNFYGRNYCLF
jgi:hypothetical protein